MSASAFSKVTIRTITPSIIEIVSITRTNSCNATMLSEVEVMISLLTASRDSPNTLIGLVRSSWTICPSVFEMLSFWTCSTIAWASSVRYPFASGRIMSRMISERDSAFALRKLMIKTSASANSGGTSIRSINSSIFSYISGRATTTTDLVRLSALASRGSPGRTSCSSLK